MQFRRRHSESFRTICLDRACTLRSGGGGGFLSTQQRADGGAHRRGDGSCTKHGKFFPSLEQIAALLYRHDVHATYIQCLPPNRTSKLSYVPRPMSGRGGWAPSDEPPHLGITYNAPTTVQPYVSTQGPVRCSLIGPNREMLAEGLPEYRETDRTLA